MEDAKDILGISRNDKSKSEMISREIINLTGGIPPIKPSFAKQALKGLKEKRQEKKSTEKWVWSSFENPARPDDLQLFHWRKKNDDEEYPFAKFNRSIELITYSDEEYYKIKHDASWSKEETDYLWDLCQKYDLRFIVIQDAYDPKFQHRSVEDLKERYYSLSKNILLLREIVTHPILSLPYNSNYEKKRKALLEKYYLRTKEQIEEEKSLCEEARKLEIRIKKEEKEMKIFEKLMSSNSEDIDISDWNQDKKEIPKGPSLRSTQLNQPSLPQRQQKKIESLLKDLGINDRPMPTEEVIDLYTKLRKEIFILLNLQKHVIKKENEKKSLEDKIKEIRSTVTKKSTSYSGGGSKSLQVTVSGKIAVSRQAGANTPSTKQTIQAMNNFHQPTPSRKISSKASKNDNEEFESTPQKRPKKAPNP